MKNRRYTIIALVLLLVALALFGSRLADPMLAKMVPVGAVSLVAFLSIIFSRQKTKDEREELHRFRAGNMAFLIGEVLIVGGYVIKAVISGEVDSFLQWVAVTMFMVNILALDSYRSKG